MSNTTIYVIILRQTQQAILVDDGDGATWWIPKSQIIEPDVNELLTGEEQDITVPIWLSTPR